MNCPLKRQNALANRGKEKGMVGSGLVHGGRRIALAAATLMLIATGAALVHSEGSGVAVTIEGASAFSIRGRRSLNRRSDAITSCWQHGTCLTGP